MRKLASCVPALLIAGCSIDSLGSRQIAADQPEATEVVRQEVNALPPGGLASSGLTTVMLTPMSAAAMGISQGARQVLAYAVGCALDSTQTISFTVGGTTFTDSGGLGLANGWTDDALSVTQAAWLSACVFAHANELSAVIWISLRGAQAELETTSAERAEYQIEEGAFWGNAFVDLGPVAAYTCDGLTQPGSSDPDLESRQCAHWDGVAGSNQTPCGMGYAGLCRSVCTTATPPYAGCSFLGQTASPVVITTYLATPPG